MRQMLLERDGETRELADAVMDAAAGTGRLVVIEGEAGIGKTELLRAARDEARSARMRVLTASGSELGQTFPFGIVRQLLEPTLHEPEPGRAALLDGVAGLAEPVFDTSAAATPPDPDTAFARMHGLTWLVTNLAAAGPVALLVDDAQWADDLSARFLTHLAKSIDQARVVLVVATRPATDRPIARLALEPAVLVLHPAPLTVGGVTTWLADELPRGTDAAVADAIIAATHGNPFFVRELVRDLRAATGPDTDAGAVDAEAVTRMAPRGVEASVKIRLGQLGEAAAELSDAIVVLGDGRNLTDLATFTGRREDELRAAARDLETAGIVETHDGLGFVHPIVRQVMHARMPPVERQLIHARAAAFLNESGAEPVEIAAHLLETEPGRDPAVVAVLRAAASRAMSLGDAVTAVAYLRRALEEADDRDRAGVLLELGAAESLSGSPEAFAHLEEARAVADDPAARAAAAFQLGVHLTIANDPRAVDALEEAHRSAPAHSDGEQLPALVLLGLAHSRASLRRRRLDQVRSLRDMGSVPATLGEVFVLCALSWTAAVDDLDIDRAIEIGDRVIEATPSVGTGSGAPPPQLLLGVVGMAHGAWRGADEILTSLLATSRRNGARTLVVAAAGLRALLRYRSGEIASADADANEALELGAQVEGAHMMSPATVAAATMIGLELDRPVAELVDLMDAVPYPRDPDILQYSQVLIARGLLCAADGRHEEAVATFEECDRDDPGWGRDCPGVVPWRSCMATSLIALGREDEAFALAAEEAEIAADAGARVHYGAAWRVAALASPAADQRERLAEAVALLEPTGNRLELARALADLGDAVRRGGDSRAARDLLRRAHDLASAGGAERLATRTRRALRVAGVRVQAAPGEGLGGLTPAERRVADLAADGASNKQIAQELFLSEKTVETHLGRVFRKLGIKSRHELPRQLQRAA